MRAPSGPGTTLSLSGAITPAALPMLCARLGDLLDDAAAQPVTCDVSRLDVDLPAIDALGRLQLAAHRLGGTIALRGATPELGDLLAICGLTGTLPSRDGQVT